MFHELEMHQGMPSHFLFLLGCTIVFHRFARSRDVFMGKGGADGYLGEEEEVEKMLWILN